MTRLSFKLSPLSYDPVNVNLMRRLGNICRLLTYGHFSQTITLSRIRTARCCHVMDLCEKHGGAGGNVMTFSVILNPRSPVFPPFIYGPETGFKANRYGRYLRPRCPHEGLTR